jgi:hypothetical protein
LTRLAAHVIAFAVGLGMLILARNEHFLFRTGRACAAVVFTSGVIAMSQQNLVGVGLILAPMFIMMVVTWLLPREDRSIEAEVEADGPQDHPLLDPTRASPTVGQARPLLGLATCAVATLLLAFAAQAALHRGMIAHGAGDGKREVAVHRPSPYHAVVDDDADGTIDDAVQTSIEVAAPTTGLDLGPEAESECPSPSGAAAEGAACRAAEGGR